jgi:uncharacterized damage-inducible protein DinB
MLNHIFLSKLLPVKILADGDFHALSALLRRGFQGYRAIPGTFGYPSPTPRCVARAFAGLFDKVELLTVLDALRKRGIDLDATIELDPEPPTTPGRAAVEELETLFAYGHWANGKLFEVIARLTPEQLTRTVDGTHGSVRNTIVHILGVEWGWIGRCGGPPRGNPLDPLAYPDLASLVALREKVEGITRAFLPTLRDADLAREAEFTGAGLEKQPFTVAEMLRHAANHGTHHRGQVSLLLRLLGFSPENFDLLFYFVERRRMG